MRIIIKDLTRGLYHSGSASKSILKSAVVNSNR